MPTATAAANRQPSASRKGSGSEASPLAWSRCPRATTPTASLSTAAVMRISHTGMRIGECVDLSFDCLRLLAPGQWALHVPLGKLHTERLVPIDDSVCQLVH